MPGTNEPQTLTVDGVRYVVAPRVAADPEHESGDASDADDVLDGIDDLIASEQGEGEDESQGIGWLKQAKALLTKFRDGEQAEAKGAAEPPPPDDDSMDDCDDADHADLPDALHAKLHKQADEPGVGDLAVPTLADSAKPARARRLNRYAQKMRELIRGKSATAEAFDAAHRQAMAHAGGMAARDARRQADEVGEPQWFEGSAHYFMEPPEWIPLLPKPGKYTHPEWGTITISSERNKRFYQNFKDAVYQEELPIDAEHQSKLSGAYGYVHDMRMNEDGSADGKVRWTPRGQKVLKEDGFTRISPEWYDKWERPDDNQLFSDILIGAGLTNRSFFKSRSLRPLAASEHVVAAGWNNPRQYAQEAPPMTSPNPTPATPEAKTFAEQLAALAAENATLKQASEQNATALKSAQEAIARQATEAQTKRFTDEIMGRSDQSDVKWLIRPQGEEDYRAAVERQVGTLRTLEQTFGENSPELAAYVGDQRALAQAMRTSEVLRAAGQPGGGDPASADARIEAMARQYTEKNPSMSPLEAQERVLREHPDLYEQAERDRTRRARE